YLASNSGQRITALQPDGALLWTAGVIAPCTDSPSIVPNASNVNGVADCEAVVAGGAGSFIAACSDPRTPPNGGTSVSARIGTGNELIGSAPISVAAGSLYTGTNRSVARSAFLGDGSLALPVSFAPNT